jgi:hypothetical protein
MNGNALFDESMLAGLQPVTEAELGARFDELAEIAVNQPDDILAIEGLKSFVIEARDNGQIGAAMQMAMTLGAMACTHDHLQSTANEVGNSLNLFGNTADEPEHSHEPTNAKHDSNHCADCKKGSCSKKRH